MKKIDVFLQLLRDASIMWKPTPLALWHVQAMEYLMVNSQYITNYIETTNIPMDVTIAEYLRFKYNGGPLPRMLQLNTW